MIPQFNIKTINDEEIKDKRVLIRVDYNVSLTEQSQIADDTRIAQTLPTLHKLFEENNKLILIAQLLPHYAGLLMEKEITAIGKIMQNPQKPVVAIIGGAKTSTKLPLLYKLTELADFLLLGGGIANTFLLTQGITIGKSIAEPDQ